MKGMDMENPYEQALVWIRRHGDTGSAVGLAKLILSLWNDDAAYSFRECVNPFDDVRNAWALKVIAHFLKHGEDKFLVDAGKEVCDLYPGLWEKGYAGSEAKRTWEKERREKLEAEQER
jgi:SLT domain-containing protein